MFDQQMTLLSVYQSQTEPAKTRWYNHNSPNSQVTKCDAFENAKDYRHSKVASTNPRLCDSSKTLVDYKHCERKYT